MSSKLNEELAALHQRVAELEATERRHRALIEHSFDVVALVEADGTLRAVTPGGPSMAGRRAEEVLGANVLANLHPEDAPRAFSLLRQLAQRPGQTVRGEFRVRHTDGSWRWREVVATNLLHEPGVQALVASFRDLTERKQMELALRAREAHLRALHAAALAVAAPVPAEPAGVAALLGRILERAVATLHGLDGNLVLGDDPAWRALVPGTGPPDGYLRLRHTGELARSPRRAQGATAHVLASGEPVFVADTLLPSRFGTYTEVQPHLVARGVRAFAAVPLRTGGRVLGVLSVNFDRPGEPDGEHREVLELFAAHAASALDRVRLEAAQREALAERSRLEGALLVARTVAHHVNNALTPVVGYAELLAAHPAVPRDPRLADYVRWLNEGAQELVSRVGRLTRIVRLREDATVAAAGLSVLDLDRSAAPEG